MTTDRDATLDQPTEPYHPSARDMIMLDELLSVSVSPDGALIAFTVRSTNWQSNSYEVLCHIYDVASGTTTPLTRSGVAIQLAWMGDRTLAVLWDNDNPWNSSQVYVYENLIGEPWQVTDHSDGVDWFAPFADGILYRADTDSESRSGNREQQFGRYTHFEQEPSASALFYVGLPELRAYEKRQRAPSDNGDQSLAMPVIELSKLLPEPLFIRSVVPSPTWDAVYLSCRKRDDLVYDRETSGFCIKLNAREALDAYLRREGEASDKKKGPDTRQSPNVTTDSEPRPSESEPVQVDASPPTGEKEDLSYLGQIVPLALPPRARVAAVSPDGRTLLVEHQGRDNKLYTRADLWLIDAGTALGAPDADAFVRALSNITAGLDRDVLSLQWAPSGIYLTYVDGTAVRLARADHASPGPGAQGHDDAQLAATVAPAAALSPIDLSGLSLSARPHISDAGRMAFIGTNASTPEEAYLADSGPEGWQTKRVTDCGAAMKGWDLGIVETIEWTSRDGTIIQGVLRKPSTFHPARRYPLVIIVHGGPAWFSPAHHLTAEDTRYYPAIEFVNKDVVVLKPNYRGSIGRGQAFRELNVNNLGVGDLWDIESGIEHLVSLGWIDPERVGCMGWSQGGYISAFAGLHSSAFRAVSVGAGISDWYTYHVSNDVPYFTIDYLSGSPFRDREPYTRAAPISNLSNAKTPMLIQHGAEDRRVPLSNAMELYRGLKEMNVPVELFIFPGMGHPITRPRENHAVMHQNLIWFSHYLLGEELKLE